MIEKVTYAAWRDAVARVADGEGFTKRMLTTYPIRVEDYVNAGGRAPRRDVDNNQDEGADRQEEKAGGLREFALNGAPDWFTEASFVSETTYLGVEYVFIDKDFGAADSHKESRARAKVFQWMTKTLFGSSLEKEVGMNGTVRNGDTAALFRLVKTTKDISTGVRAAAIYRNGINLSVTDRDCHGDIFTWVNKRAKLQREFNDVAKSVWVKWGGEVDDFPNCFPEFLNVIDLLLMASQIPELKLKAEEIDLRTEGRMPNYDQILGELKAVWHNKKALQQYVPNARSKDNNDQAVALQAQVSGGAPEGRPCRLFMKGKCTYGSKCKFAHLSGAAGAQTSGGGQSSSGNGSQQQAGSTMKKCLHCDKLGHLKKECWILHPELRPSKNNGKAQANVAAAATIEEVTDDASVVNGLVARVIQSSGTSQTTMASDYIAHALKSQTEKADPGMTVQISAAKQTCGQDVKVGDCNLAERACVATIMDSGASEMILPGTQEVLKAVKRQQSSNALIEVYGGGTMKAVCKGVINMELGSDQSKMLIENVPVLVVDEAAEGLCALRVLSQRGVTTVLHEGKMVLIKSNEFKQPKKQDVLMELTPNKNGLYEMNIIDAIKCHKVIANMSEVLVPNNVSESQIRDYPVTALSTVSADAESKRRQDYIAVHEVVGHAGPTSIRKLFPNMLLPTDTSCQYCDTASLKRRASRRQVDTNRNQKMHLPGESVDGDLAGPFIRSRAGNHYGWVNVDKASGLLITHPLAKKNQMKTAFPFVRAKFRAITGNKMRSYCPDNDGIFIDQAFREALADKNIDCLPSLPYDHDSNPYAERAIQTVERVSKTVRKRAGLSRAFWAESWKYAEFVINVVWKYKPKPGAEDGSYWTRFEWATGRDDAKPYHDIKELAPFGCKVTYLPGEQRLGGKTMISDNGFEGIYMGPDSLEREGARVYDPKSKKVYRVSRRRLKIYPSIYPMFDVEWRKAMRVEDDDVPVDGPLKPPEGTSVEDLYEVYGFAAEDVEEWQKQTVGVQTLSLPADQKSSPMHEEKFPEAAIEVLSEERGPRFDPDFILDVEAEELKMQDKIPNGGYTENAAIEQDMPSSEDLRQSAVAGERSTASTNEWESSDRFLGPNTYGSSTSSFRSDSGKLQNGTSESTRKFFGPKIQGKDLYFGKTVLQQECSKLTGGQVKLPIEDLVHPMVSSFSAETVQAMVVATEDEYKEDDGRWLTGVVPADKAPKNDKEAMRSPNATAYEAARKADIETLLKLGVFKFVKRDSVPHEHAKKLLKARFVYSHKKMWSNGEVKLLAKARLVALGYMQEHMLNYQETYASTPSLTTLRTLMALAVQLKIQPEHWDAKSAFQNAPIEDDIEIYMEQVPGMEYLSKDLLQYAVTPEQSKELEEALSDGDEVAFDKNIWVVRLWKALNGTKQGARQWQRTLRAWFIAAGFELSKHDTSCYYWIGSNGACWVPVEVDDLYVFALGDAGEQKRNELWDLIASKVELKNLGALKSPLNTHYATLEGSSLRKLSMEPYIDEMLTRFGFENAKPADNPSCGIALPDCSCDQCKELQTAGECDEKLWEEDASYPCREALGCLFWPTVICRPDIAEAVNKVSLYASKPSKGVWKLISKIMRYLKGTKATGIIIGREFPESAEVSQKAKHSRRAVKVWVDASFANLPDFKSTHGCILTFMDTPVAWWTRKIKRVVSSSTEAETHALMECGRDLLWFMGLISELNIDQLLLKQFPKLEMKPMVYEDNSPTIGICDRGPRRKQRHFQIEGHWVHEQTKELNKFDIVYVPTDDQHADMFTKNLPRDVFRQHRDFLMGSPDHQEVFPSYLESTNETDPEAQAKKVRACMVRRRKKPEEEDCRFNRRDIFDTEFHMMGVEYCCQQEARSRIADYPQWDESPDSYSKQHTWWLERLAVDQRLKKLCTWNQDKIVGVLDKLREGLGEPRSDNKDFTELWEFPEELKFAYPSGALQLAAGQMGAIFVTKHGRLTRYRVASNWARKKFKWNEDNSLQQMVGTWAEYFITRTKSLLEKFESGFAEELLLHPSSVPCNGNMATIREKVDAAIHGLSWFRPNPYEDIQVYVSQLIPLRQEFSYLSKDFGELGAQCCMLLKAYLSRVELNLDGDLLKLGAMLGYMRAAEIYDDLREGTGDPMEYLTHGYKNFKGEEEPTAGTIGPIPDLRDWSRSAFGASIIKSAMSTAFSVLISTSMAKCGVKSGALSEAEVNEGVFRTPPRELPAMSEADQKMMAKVRLRLEAREKKHGKDERSSDEETDSDDDAKQTRPKLIWPSSRSYRGVPPDKLGEMCAAGKPIPVMIPETADMKKTCVMHFKGCWQGVRGGRKEVELRTARSIGYVVSKTCLCGKIASFLPESERPIVLEKADYKEWEGTVAALLHEGLEYAVVTTDQIISDGSESSDDYQRKDG